MRAVPLPVLPAPSGTGRGPSAPPEPSDLAPPPTRPPVADLLPGWVATAVAAVCIGVGVALVAVLLWLLLRDTIRVRGRPLAEAEGDPAALAAARAREVTAAVDAGLADLSDADADPRRAVIACWVLLEQAAAAAGTARAVGDTPADLVGRLLAAHQVSGPVLDRFAAVYREARYATHVVDEPMRTTAVSALRQLRTELA